jgi:Ser/Thr protein kinase RdoA (MazF antagonist)
MDEQPARAVQRNRFKRLGEIALQRYGIEQAKLTFVSDTASVVFRVRVKNRVYALRIDPESPTSQLVTWLRAELLWLQAIRRDTDILVPAPVVAQDGALVSVVAMPGSTAAHPVSLLHWLPGALVGAGTTLDIAAQMGALMARLHDHTEQFHLPADADRSHTDWRKLAYWHDMQNNTSKTLTPEQREICAAASKRLLIEIDQIGTDRDYGLVHADMHPGNCLLHDGQLGLIDFGDCRYASHFYDMSVPLTFWHEFLEYEALRAAFFEGYSQVRPLSARCESAVHTFMIARAFDNIEWIHFDWPSLTHHDFGPSLVNSSVAQIRHYLDSV